jgi:hypothetical protein
MPPSPYNRRPYSGAGLLPDIASALNAAHQVWFTAWIPDGIRTCRQEAATYSSGSSMMNGSVKTPTSDPVVATYFLFHDCNFATLQWGLTALRLFFPQVAYEQPSLGPRYPVYLHHRY